MGVMKRLYTERMFKGRKPDEGIKFLHGPLTPAFTRKAKPKPKKVKKCTP